MHILSYKYDPLLSADMIGLLAPEIRCYKIYAVTFLAFCQKNKEINK